MALEEKVYTNFGVTYEEEKQTILEQFFNNDIDVRYHDEGCPATDGFGCHCC